MKETLCSLYYIYILQLQTTNYYERRPQRQGRRRTTKQQSNAIIITLTYWCDDALNTNLEEVTQLICDVSVVSDGRYMLQGMAWHSQDGGGGKVRERGSAPKRGRHSTICFPPNASVQWQPDGLTIYTKKWFLGARFLGAPPSSLTREGSL